LLNHRDVGKASAPAHAPYLHPCRQCREMTGSFPVLAVVKRLLWVLAFAGGACTPARGNLTKLFRTHSLKNNILIDKPEKVIDYHIADSRKITFTKDSKGAWKGGKAKSRNIAIGWLNPEAK